MAVSAFSRNHGTAHFRGTSILRHMLQAASSCLLAAQLAFAPFAFAGGDKPAPAAPATPENDPDWTAMHSELAGAVTELAKEEQRTDYPSCTVSAQEFVDLAA